MKRERIIMEIKALAKSAIAAMTALLLLCQLAACTKADTGTGTGTRQSGAGSTGAASMTAVKTTSKTTAKSTASGDTGSSAKAGATTTGATSLVTGNPDNAGAESEDGNGNAASDTDVSGSADSGEGDGDDSPVVKEREKFDLKGRKIIFATWAKNYTYDYFKTLNVEFTTFTKRLDYLEETHNCTIELAPYASSTSFQNALMTNALAGTYYADALLFVGSWTMKFHEFLQPLNQWIDFNDPKKMTNSGQASLLWKGNYYNVLLQNKISYDVYILCNRDIIGREGLPDPLTLQRNGQWTWNSLLDIAIKATKDLNGDGIIDQWGFVRDKRASFDTLVKAFIASNGGYIIDNTKGDYRLGLADSNALKALYFINDLQNVYRTGELYNNTDAYILGNAAMAFGNMPSTKPYLAEYPRNSFFALYPKGPDVDRHIINNTSAGGQCGSMPYNVVEPEKIAQILYGLCSVYDDTYPDYVAGINVPEQFSTYIFSEDDYETLEMSKSIIEKYGSHFDPYAYLTTDLNATILTGTNSLMYTILMKNIPVQTAVDSIRDGVSNTITTLIEKYRKTN